MIPKAVQYTYGCLMSDRGGSVNPNKKKDFLVMVLRQLSTWKNVKLDSYYTQIWTAELKSQKEMVK